MDFEEIPAGAKIIMNISNDGEMQAKFISRAIKNTGSGILVLPFVHKGRRVNFNGKNIHIHMDVQLKTGEIFTFKGCQIMTVRKDGLIFHKVVSSMTKGIENRRGEHRCYVGETAYFIMEGLPDQITAVLKDISNSGFGFIIDRKKNIELMPGVMVTCTFKNHLGKYIQMQGKIIRREKMDRHTLYGCRCTEANADVEEFVSQIEEKTLIINDSLVQMG